MEFFEHLVDAYSNDLLRLCFALLGDHALAEDAVQECFIKVWRNLHRCPAAEKPWLCRIAINTCKDLRKSAWHRHNDLRISLDELPEEMLSVPQKDRELLLDVMRLPAPCKEVVLLRHYEGLTQTEIARLLRISRTAVSKRLERAYRMLRDEKGEKLHG